MKRLESGKAGRSVRLLPKICSMKGINGEEPANAGRAVWEIEGVDAIGGNTQAGLQGGDELGEAVLLGRGGAGLVEVADEADAQTGGVDAGDAGRGGGDGVLV